MIGLTYQQVANIISDICDEFEIGYAYYSFPTDQAPPLPYVVYFYPDREDFIADNENYRKVETLVIELYSETKNFELEQGFESYLKDNGIVYDKTETFINKENMFQCYYEAQVIIIPEELPES